MGAQTRLYFPLCCHIVDLQVLSGTVGTLEALAVSFSSNRNAACGTALSSLPVMVSFINKHKLLSAPPKALNSPPVCSGPSANAHPCRPASLRCRCRSPHRPSFDDTMFVCLCVCSCVSLRSRVSRCVRTAALCCCACRRSSPSLRGEPTTPSGGCDGRERRSGGGALGR